MKNDVHQDENQNPETGDPLSEIQLTTFALGELPAKERMEMESLLKSDETRRAEFEEIRSTATLLSTELKSEGLPELTEEEKQRIREAVGAAPNFPAIKPPSKIVRIGRYAAFGAVAACLAVATVSLWNLRPDGNLARNEKGLTEEDLIAREKQQALERIVSLTTQIEGQDVKLASARTAMLDKMEELNIPDLSASDPSWMRGDAETGTPEYLVRTQIRAYDQEKAAKETLEEQLAEARQSLAAAELASNQLIASNNRSNSFGDGMEADPTMGEESLESLMRASTATEKKSKEESENAYAGKKITKNKTAASANPFGNDAIAQPSNNSRLLKKAPSEGGQLSLGIEPDRSSGIASSQAPDADPMAPTTAAAESPTAFGRQGTTKDAAPSTAPEPEALSFDMAIAGGGAAPSVAPPGARSRMSAQPGSASTRGSTVPKPAPIKSMTGLPADLITDESIRFGMAGVDAAAIDDIEDAYDQPESNLSRADAQRELSELEAKIKRRTTNASTSPKAVAKNELSPEQERYREVMKQYQEAADAAKDPELSEEERTKLETGLEELAKKGHLLEGDKKEFAERRAEEVEVELAGALARKKQLEDFLHRPPALDPSNEDYGKLKDNPWISSWDENFSTFSIDVDTASYSNVRRFVANRNQMPPADAVRIEELINYFDYEYPQPEGEHPFAVTTEVAGCPWAPDHRLVRIGLKGKEMFPHERPPMNLVFLIDVSGSMESQSKLPLLKTSMKHLVSELSPRDRVAMVVYAGKAGLILDATTGDRKDEIKGALEKLQSGGSTAGGAGIQLAYKIAKENHIDGGVNRVILATDGDFNVGNTDTGDLTTMVANRAKSDDTFLTILGFGEGNLKESRMEQIANKGNGNYYYIDNEKEGRRVLVDKLSATLVTIAKDVKIQVDFNPGKVGYYRLIGYANRLLNKRDFDDDQKDAGEIGAGHTVTALYEVVPAGVELQKPHGANPTSRYLAGGDDPSEKIERKKAKNLIKSPEMLTVKLRYKQPEGTVSTLLEVPLEDLGRGWAQSSEDFRFAAAVAGYGMMLRDSTYRGSLGYDQVLELAIEGSRREDDPHGLRAEFIEMVKTTKRITGN